MEDLQASPRKIFSSVAKATSEGASVARSLLGSRRLVLVSNREPYVRRRTADGIRFERNAGGLVSALDPVMTGSGGVWVAWLPNADIEAAPETNELRPESPAEEPPFTLRQVPLTQKEVARYYYGFANRSLWPLCHYFVDRCRFDAEEWRQYVRINERFADAVVAESRPGDIVWVHDYHFCLLPQAIRERRRFDRSDPIAFFFHIPFPAHEVFRALPWRREVLTGILGADLVGFHIETYADHFLDCCERQLGAEVDPIRRVVRWQGREVRVGAFPIGIDVTTFRALAAEPAVERRVARIRQGLGGARLILGVDRLDYSKGIPERLYAIDALFEARPELVGKIVFLQLAVPSRTQVREYRELKQRVEELVGRVNGRHGTASWQPIRYLYRSVPREELVAYYRAADVCLVNPLRDGMNLVSMEYVACRGGDGVLVLSELAGAAHALGNAALLVNPFAIQETAMALSQALEMDASERAHRMRRLMKRVEDTDVHRWLERILGAALSGDGVPSGETLLGPSAEVHDLAAALPSQPGAPNPFH